MLFNTYKIFSYQLLLFTTNVNTSEGMNDINKLNLFNICIGKKLNDIKIDTDSLIYSYIEDAVSKYLPSNEKSYNSMISDYIFRLYVY